jgi:hypothetical protein
MNEMGLKPSPAQTKRFRLLELPDKPLSFIMVPEEEICPEIFRNTGIRCMRAIHLDDGRACYASGRDPYFAVFWERIREPNVESTDDQHRPARGPLRHVRRKMSRRLRQGIQERRKNN